MDFAFVERAAAQVADLSRTNPHLLTKASGLSEMYAGKRALMVIDVVTSRQRHYESQVKKILTRYEEQSSDLSLSFLAANPPAWLALKQREPETISRVAQTLLDFGNAMNIVGDDEIALAWSQLPSGDRPGQVPDPWVEKILAIWGIGEVLMQYLRLLCGADTLKVDVRIVQRLEHLGVPVDLFTTKGLLEICREIATIANVSMAELDQLLWNQ